MEHTWKTFRIFKVKDKTFKSLQFVHAHLDATITLAKFAIFHRKTSNFLGKLTLTDRISTAFQKPANLKSTKGLKKKKKKIVNEQTGKFKWLSRNKGKVRLVG